MLQYRTGLSARFLDDSGDRLENEIVYRSKPPPKIRRTIFDKRRYPTAADKQKDLGQRSDTEARGPRLKAGISSSTTLM
jgi:hypothetical protein